MEIFAIFMHVFVRMSQWMNTQDANLIFEIFLKQFYFL